MPIQTRDGWIDVLLRILALIGIAYLILPILVMFPLSVESGRVLQFPPRAISLRWYAEFLSDDAWIRSTILSLKIATVVSVLATAFGTLAAVGLARVGSIFRGIANLVLLSPIFLPTIIVAIAIYSLFATFRLVGTPSGIVIAHAVLTIPFVLLNVSSALSAVPRSLEDAAVSLGANSAVVFFRVTVPLIWRGIVAGAVFSFLVSFDEVVIAMFLSGTDSVTLPKRMLDGMFYEMTPMLASISVLLVVFNILLIAAAMALLRSGRNGAASSLVIK